MRKLAEKINPDKVILGCILLFIIIIWVVIAAINILAWIITSPIFLVLLFSTVYPEWKDIYEKAHRNR